MKAYNKEYRRQQYLKHRSKTLETQAKYRKTEHRQNYRLMYYFGITLEQYKIMLAKQNYTCDICKKPETENHGALKKPAKLVVDHNHKTKKVRALLCAKCNKALGMLRDSKIIAKSAYKYLVKHDA